MIYTIPALMAAIFALFIGFLVYSKNKSVLHRQFFILSLCLFSWLFGCFGQTVTIHKNIAVIFDKLLYTGVILYPISFLYFVFFNLKKDVNKKNKFFIIIKLITVGFLFVNYFDPMRGWFIKDVSRRYIFRFIAFPGVLWYLLITYVTAVVNYGLFLLGKELFKTQGVNALRLRYLLSALILLTVGGIMYFGLVINIYTPPVDNLLACIALSLIAYSIVRYRLLDIRIVLTRGAILLIVYGCIVTFPLAFAALSREWLVRYMGAKWFYPPLGMYTILALLAPYIYVQLQTKAEQKQIQRQIRLHQSLKNASKTTIEVQSIDKLSKIIPRYLLRLYGRMDNKITHISLFLKDQRKRNYHLQSSVGEEKIIKDTIIEEDSYLVRWFTNIRDILIEHNVVRAKEVEVLVYEDIDFWMTKPGILNVPFKGITKILKELKFLMTQLKANVILPSVYQKELLGFLVLGEKIPDAYTVSDIDTFSILANDSAMAFKAAQLFEELKMTQARLMQSEKLSLLGQLASSMAHEINNPLAIISGNVQLLLMDEEDKKKKELLKKVNDQTERGYKIINRLLNFSRLPKEEIKEIDPAELIEDTLELVGHKILHGNIHIDRDFAPVSAIKGNSTQIQEVILNLFVNAIQAMPDGGRLKIRIGEHKNFVQIEVSDTGKGIEDEDLKNIFDPFYTKGKENGTGLGLFVASQIMGLHNGTIYAKSKIGQGTTFVLRFPIQFGEQ